jgi:hypothetical protein
VNCREFLTVIEEYLDGELESHDARRVRAHISTCLGCAQVHEEMYSAQEFLLSNQRLVRLRPELWSAVHEKIKQEKIHRGETQPKNLRQQLGGILEVFYLRHATSAAALLLLLALGTVIGLRVLSNAPDSQHFQQAFVAKDSIAAVSTSQPRASVHQTDEAKMDAIRMGSNIQPGLIPSAGSELRKNAGRRVLTTHKPVESAAERRQSTVAELRPLSDTAVREAEQKYLDTINLLARDAQASRSSVNSESLTSYDEAISVVDRAIDSTRRAVREQPGDLVAVQYMMSAYEKKVELLKGLASYKDGGND